MNFSLKIASNFLITYFDFLLSPSGLFMTSPFENPYSLFSMHLSIDFLISKRWIELRLEVHTTRLREGWKVIVVIIAFSLPRLSS